MMNSGPTARIKLPLRLTETRYKPGKPLIPLASIVLPTASDHGVTFAPTITSSLSLSLSALFACEDDPVRLPLCRFPPGNKYRENISTYTIPLNATGTPYFPKSKRPISTFSAPTLSLFSFAHVSNIPATTKFVDVPINVHVPPNIEENDRGIKTCFFDIPLFSAHRWTIGIMTATTGVLFKNADIMAIGIINRICADAIVFGLPKKRPMYQSKPPVLDMPCATTNKAATVSNPSLANPCMPSSTVITFPVIKRARAAQNSKSDCT